MRALLIVALLVSGGCSSFSRRPAPADLNIPLVRAVDGSTGSLSVTSCFVGANGQQSLEFMLQTLTSHGVLVSAEGGATSRLVLNACPTNVDANLIRAAGEAAREAARVTTGRR